MFGLSHVEKWTLLFEIFFSAAVILIMVYPLIKAYGMTVIKSPEDPLQGISKLNFMIIISSTQVVLPSFYPTMIVGDEWR